MAAVAMILNAAATLAFGAVYPWGYFPLFAAAALVGLVGIIRGGSAEPSTRVLAASLFLVAAAISVQLLPLSHAVLNTLSPHLAELLGGYSLTFNVGSQNHSLSANPSATTLSLIGFVTLGIYLVGMSGAFSSAALRAFPRNLLLFSVPLSLFGIVSRGRGNGLIYWFWTPQDGGGSNSFGPFVNRNHFAGWMLMAFCLGSGLFLGQLQRAGRVRKPSWRSRAIWLSSPETSKIILTASALVVMATSLVWTMSRSGIVSFVVALACFAWLIAQRGQIRGVWRAAALAILALALAISISVRGSGALATWFGDTTDFESRLAAWQDGWRVVRDFPVVGTGMNTFGTVMLFYQRSNKGVHLGSAHNDYLQLLSEGGLLVAVPAVLAVVCLVVAIRLNLQAAQHESRGYWIRAGAAVGLIGIAVQESAEFSLQIPANAFLFCTLAAIALAPVDRSSTWEKS